MARPKTKTATQSKNEYARRVYHRPTIQVPKEVFAQFKERCDQSGTNPNRLINEWIQRYISE
jgi:hypothetical protein